MSTQLTFDPSVHGQTKQSKVERYGWKLVDSPGESTLIHKDKLTVDASYQRDANTNKVRAIASKWSWIACGCLIVGHRDGVYYVIDGGHRVLAARSRTDIGKLPCIVFETEDVKEEAQGFLNANTQRKPMTSVEKFKAMIIVGDPAACKINELLTKAGYEVTDATLKSSTRRVKCVRALTDCYTRNPEAFLRIWPLVLEVSDNTFIAERVLESLFYLETLAMKQDMTITKSPWKQRIIRIGMEGIITYCNKAAAFYSRGGAKVWAAGVMEGLNRGARNRLDLFSGNASENGDSE